MVVTALADTGIAKGTHQEPFGYFVGTYVAPTVCVDNQFILIVTIEMLYRDFDRKRRNPVYLLTYFVEEACDII